MRVLPDDAGLTGEDSRSRSAPASAPASLSASGPAPEFVTVQILLDLKNHDPSALTASEAIRTLLGFGDRLISIHRRVLHELVLRRGSDADRPASPANLIGAYLDRTVVLWNPNKQRAWVRIREGSAREESWAVQSAARRGDATFGRPDLSRPEYDHLLVWPRGGHRVPADLVASLPGWELAAASQGELWSVQWRSEASAAERSAWTRRIGAARSRSEGLLFNPHAQDHLGFAGAVPIPVGTGEASPADPQT